MFDSSRLCIYLTIEINIHGIVDGNKVIQCGDRADVVRVVDRSAHQFRVVVQIIVHFLGAGAESVGLAVTVDILFGTVDLTCLCNIDKCIHVHLSVNAEILQVGLCNQGTDSVWHAADTEL